MQGTRDTENDSPLGVTVSSGLLCPHCPCPHWPPTMLWQAEFLNLPVSTKSMLSQSCLCGRDRDYSLNDIVGPLTTPAVFRLRESRVDRSPDITGTRTETFTSHRTKEYWNLIATWLTGGLEVVLGRLCLGKKNTESSQWTRLWSELCTRGSQVLRERVRTSLGGELARDNKEQFWMVCKEPKGKKGHGSRDGWVQNSYFRIFRLLDWGCNSETECLFSVWKALSYPQHHKTS